MYPQQILNRNPLTAIFAHAMKYYNLPKNPSSLAGTIGKEVPKEMQFWTKEEYLKFAEVMMDKPRSYYAFELLYWTGIRSGELLALTPSDFDFGKQTLRINKTFHRSKGEDIITTPKTVKSNRIITLPPFLCDEIKDYLGMFYEIGESERMFSFTKSYLGHEMERGCKASGVKKIRIHDLRHSHVSLLINMGFSALAIGKRVGHTSKEKVIAQGIPHLVYPRFTRVVPARGVINEKMHPNEAYDILHNDKIRDEQIIEDISACIKQGRTPVVLSKYKDHSEKLYHRLKEYANHVFLMTGNNSKKVHRQILEQMKLVSENETMILVATGSLIGEGFDFPRLDTLFMAMPVSARNIVEAELVSFLNSPENIFLLFLRL